MDSRLSRAAERAERLVGPLQQRFAVVLVLLVLTTPLPWLISLRVETALVGSARRIDWAGSLRLGVVQIDGAIRSGERPGRIREMARALRGRIAAMITGDDANQLQACSTAATCDRLRAHIERWDDLTPRLTRSADVSRELEREGRELDLTVHALAREEEARARTLVQAGLGAGAGSLVLIGLVALGVGDVFRRIRRVEKAARGTDAQRLLADAAASRTDEVGDLAAILASSLVQAREAAERQARERIASLLAATHELPDRGRELGATLREIVPHEVTWIELAELGSYRIEDSDVRGAEMPVAAQAPTMPSCLAHGDRSLLAVALVVEGERVGALMLERARPFSSTDAEAIARVVPILEAAFGRMQLSARVRATAQLAVLGSLARMVAHEVRNPLNGLELHAELLERRFRRADGGAAAELARTAGEDVAGMRAQARRIAWLVDSIDGVAHTGALALESVDLARVARTSLDNQQAALCKLGIEAALRLDGASAADAWADRRRASQVVDAMIAGTMDLGGNRMRRLDVTVRRVSGRVELVVTGAQKAPSDPQTVFAAVSLAMAEHLARMQHGALAARSATDGSLELVLQLPAPSA